MTMSKQEAASRLGMGVHEVVDVADSKVGTVIRTMDGVAYVDVSPDQPDAAGRSGLMYLVKPNEKYAGTFPVFAGGTAKEDSLLRSLGIELDDAPERSGLTETDAQALITDPGPGRKGRGRRPSPLEADVAPSDPAAQKQRAGDGGTDPDESSST